MPKPWYKRTLLAEEALKRANTCLQQAHEVQDRQQAQKQCDEAMKELERIDESKSLKDLDRIITVYREHGKLLEKLGLSDKARFSYGKADELRYVQVSRINWWLLLCKYGQRDRISNHRCHC